MFAFGLLINGFPYFPLGTLRIYGVLQRIAICFLIAGILYLLDQRPSQQNCIDPCRIIWLLVFAAMGSSAGLWHAGSRYSVCSIPSSISEPTLTDMSFPAGCIADVRDPEGLLSNIPALATTLLGMLTAMWLGSKRPAAIKAWGMLVAGILGIILGQVWGHWFPINKNLWSSSYVLFAAGIALVALSICYWAIDIKNWRTGWTYVWLVFGMNAITAYIFSELLSSILYTITVPSGTGPISLSGYVFTRSFAAIPWPHLAALAYSISFVAVCFIPVAILYKKKIFLKV